MDRVIVDDKIDRSLGIMEQPFKEFNEGSRIDVFIGHHEVQCALGTNGREHIDFETCSGGIHNRRLPFNGPSGAGVVIRADGRFVSPKNGRARSLSHGLDSGIIGSHPGNNQPLVLLIGAPQRPLGRKTEFFQHSANGDLAEADLKERVMTRLKLLQSTPEIVLGFFRHPDILYTSMFANQ